MARRDLTKLFQNSPDFRKQLKKLDDYAQGNKGKVWLNKAEVTITKDLSFKVHIKVRDKHQWRVGPPWARKTVTAYDNTHSIYLKGLIPGNGNCKLAKFNVSASGALTQLVLKISDIFKLANLPNLQKKLQEELCPKITGAGFSTASADSVDSALEDSVLTATDLEVHPAALTSDLIEFDLKKLIESFKAPTTTSVDLSLPITLTENGKKELTKASFGIINDLKADIDFSFDKSDLLSLLKTPTVEFPTFEIDITADPNNDPIQVGLTIAPTVTLTNGRAVDASLGVLEVDGLPEFISVKLEEILEENTSIKEAIVDFVNGALN